MNKNLIAKITNYIFIKAPRERAGLAMMFGTRHDEAIDLACEIYRQKLAPKILVSGGINRVTGENEAEIMSEKMVLRGIPRSDILLENKSSNSLENVLFSKKILLNEIESNRIKKIIAVVKNYHARRALMTLKKHFPKNIKIIPAVYTIEGLTKDNWFKSKLGQEKVLGEWEKIPKYLAKGDIEEL